LEYYGLLRKVSQVSYFRKIYGCSLWFSSKRSLVHNVYAFGWVDGLDGSDKPVAPPWKSLHKSRVVGRVIQSPTESFDGRVKAMFKIHVGVSRPESPVKLFARN
jgi:hypothetical protein